MRQLWPQVPAMPTPQRRTAPDVAPALVMAGGASTRMRAARGPQHKALVPVLGVPLVDRNLLWLMAQGFADVHVAVAEGETELIEHLHRRSEPLVRALGGRLSLLVELQPLGTLGACRLCPTEGDVVVVNVDNLTTLDLRAMLSQHRQTGSALTIASHDETFRMPFGQLVLDGHCIARMVEKPSVPYCISSGTYVLTEVARNALPPHRPAGPLELLQTLQARELPLHAFRHDAPWIDVNDADALARATALVRAHGPAMECLWAAPHSERLLLWLPDVGAAWISEVDESTRWLSTPGAEPQGEHMASFDQPDRQGRIHRCHLFRLQPDGARPPDGFSPLAEDVNLRDGDAVARCLAYAARQLAKVPST